MTAIAQFVEDEEHVAMPPKTSRRIISHTCFSRPHSRKRFSSQSILAAGAKVESELAREAEIGPDITRSKRLEAVFMSKRN